MEELRGWANTWWRTRYALGRHTCDPPAPTIQLRTLSTWYDYAASTSAARTLVNDLNLAVLLPTANEPPPWKHQHAVSSAAAAWYCTATTRRTPIPTR